MPAPLDLDDLMGFLGESFRRERPLAGDAALERRCAEHVTGNERLTPAEQVDIYRRQYWLRHVDSLVEDYPGLSSLIGEEAFDAFIQESDAVIAHDVEAQLGKIRAPTQMTFGRYDMVTSTRFAARLANAIERSELHIFEDCSHAPLYENVAAFNATTMAFLSRHAG